MQIRRTRSRSSLMFALDVVMAIVAAFAIASLIIELGDFDVSEDTSEKLDILNWIIIAVFVAESFVKWGFHQFRLEYLRRNWADFALICIFLVPLAIIGYTSTSPQTEELLRRINLSVARAYIIVAQLYILGSVLLRAFRTGRRITRMNLPAAQIVAFSFLFVIMAGTGFLLLPRARGPSERFLFDLAPNLEGDLDNGIISADLRQEFEDNENPLPPESVVFIQKPGNTWHITDADKTYIVVKEAYQLKVYAGAISFINALFTATSATCVTGLIVVDTGSYFSRFGQIVILVLIQIGGLGLMTTTAFFALILGRGMSVKESVLMSDVLSSKTLSRVSHLIISILILTIVFEAIGILSFYLAWSGFEGFEHGSRLYYSVFHSISAFCNAGFSLFHDSFERFKGSVSHNAILASLIVIGGLGFTVIMNSLRFGIFKRERLSLQTKLVLVVTASLIVSGFALILITEWNNSLRELPFTTKLMAAYFQSVTPRTAGFNTIGIGRLTNSCYLLMMILMFIGASPGSTGGGIKTSTFGIFLGSIWSMLKGRDSVEMFRRSVPREVVNKVLSVIIMALMLLSTFGFILLLTQKGDPIHILFELVSAFGTVGLSAGVTPHLTTLGKVIIIMTMFIGRIGPLTLALAIGQRRESVAYEYPDEAVMIG